MRHRSAVTIVIIITTIVLTLGAKAQVKPFTPDQVQGMVRDGLGDATGAKATEQRGMVGPWTITKR